MDNGTWRIRNEEIRGLMVQLNISLEAEKKLDTKMGGIYVSHDIHCDDCGKVNQ